MLITSLPVRTISLESAAELIKYGLLTATAFNQSMSEFTIQVVTKLNVADFSDRARIGISKVPM